MSKYIDEWNEVVEKKAKVPIQTPSVRWEPPEQGWILANVDGAVSKHGAKGGGGVVLRDHDGAFGGAAARFFPDSSKPEMVELLACRKAIQFAAAMGVQKLQVELDCKEAVRMINNPNKDLSMSGPIVEDIKGLVKAWRDCRISWKRRSANRAAHTLAKAASCRGGTLPGMASCASGFCFACNSG